MSTNRFFAQEECPGWLLRGKDALRLRQFETALLHFAEGIGSNQYAVQAQIGIGNAFEGLGKIEAARLAYQHAVGKAPECAEAAVLLGDLGEAPPIPQEWHVGKRLTSDLNRNWHYKVRKVKHGGFGVVYIVSDFENQPMVLKTLKGCHSWNEEDRRRFEREIVTWMRIGSHPHIVRAICLDRIEGRPVLMMEYMPKGSIRDALAHGPLAVESAMAFGLDLCAGMGYAHKTFGIVHRDLNPSNCLLSKTRRLKVTDFGLAKVFGELMAREFGLPEVAMNVALLISKPNGTDMYMPPEQFEPGAVLDTRADVYSFGVMLFEMLSGEKPGFGPVAQEFVQQCEAYSTLPNSLQEIILRCTERERNDRPSDFSCLQVELGEVYRRIVGSEPPAIENTPPTNEMDYNALGMTFLQLGHLAEALQFFDHGLDISPSDRYLLTNKGNALRKSGRYEEALKCYKGALQVADDVVPGRAAIWGNVAQLYIQVNDYRSALSAFEKALEITPNDPVLIANKAVAVFRLDKTSEALALSASALTANPNDGTLLIARVDMLFELGRHRDALELIDHAIHIDPLNHLAWARRAECLQMAGEYHNAITCARRSLELRPQQPQLIERMARLLKLTTNSNIQASGSYQMEES